MNKKPFKLKSLAVAVALSNLAALSANAEDRAIEKIVVTAEKRNESLQDLSQAVTALTAKDLDNKYISSFVDLSAIAPGVTVRKMKALKQLFLFGA